MTDLVERHRRACRLLSSIAARLTDEQWVAADAVHRVGRGALVEHVIGFHEFLLLRPLGVRAHRPKTGPAARWKATERSTMFDALTEPGRRCSPRM